MAIDLLSGARCSTLGRDLLELVSIPFRPELREHAHFQGLLETARDNSNPRAREAAIRRVTLVVEELEHIISENGRERAGRHERVELYLNREYSKLVSQLCASLIDDSSARVRSACVTASNILLGGEHQVALTHRTDLLNALQRANDREKNQIVKYELDQSVAFWNRRFGGSRSVATD